MLKPAKAAQIVAMLSEGCSIRSIERLTGVHRDTIMHRQADNSVPPDRDPGADVWGTDMATSIGERRPRRRLADRGHPS